MKEQILEASDGNEYKITVTYDSIELSGSRARLSRRSVGPATEEREVTVEGTLPSCLLLPE